MTEELEQLKQIFIDSYKSDLPIRNLDTPFESIDKISNQVQVGVSDAKSGLIPEQIELRLLEKIADNIAIRDYPSLSKTSKSIILKYFGKLIKEKTDSFLSR